METSITLTFDAAGLRQSIAAELRSIAQQIEPAASGQFNTPEALAEWLESLHECGASGEISAGKWKPAQAAARAIRALSAASRFTRIAANGQPAPDGVPWVAVRDNTTGLMWSAENVGGKHDFDSAQRACRALDLAGHGDWRLPTLQELLSLVDYTRCKPAIDTDFFPTCRSEWYWTSTPYASVSSYAWIVHFSYGLAGYGRRDVNLGFVRAVRGGGVSPGQ